MAAGGVAVKLRTLDAFLTGDVGTTDAANGQIRKANRRDWWEFVPAEDLRAGQWVNVDERGHVLRLATAASSTSTTHTSPPLPSLLEGIRQIEATIQARGPEPIGEWMRAQGFPPESCFLVLPETEKWRAVAGPFFPQYVRFSAAINEPCLCRNPSAEGLA